MFAGVCTALVTPFDKKNNIDYEKTKKLLDFQLENGIKNILILGSTGEGFCLKKEEKHEFIRFVRKALPRKCNLIVGASSNSVEEIVSFSLEAKSLGANALLVSTPFFVKCTQRGIYEFFESIIKRSELPIIIYNIPSRSGNNIEPRTMKKLCELKNIVGLKEANGDINHILAMFKSVNKLTNIYCGNDNLNLVFASLGAKGTISVSSNVYPSRIRDIFENKSLVESEKLYEFNNLMFVEPNPIPVKYALSKLKKIENNLRPPLTRLSNKNTKLLDEQIKTLKS